MGIGRRQIFRLCRAFEAYGPSGLVSKKRGRPRPSNRKHGDTFRLTDPLRNREVAGPSSRVLCSAFIGITKTCQSYLLHS